MHSFVPTSCFIDLATRDYYKANPFLDGVKSKCPGYFVIHANFGQTVIFKQQSLTGLDLLDNITLQIEFPAVKLAPHNAFGQNGKIQWSTKLMHTLIKSLKIKNKFNNQYFDVNTFVLDFMQQFFLSPHTKQTYKQLTSNLSNDNSSIDSFQLQLPLHHLLINPIPVTNDLEIEICFREWQDLLILKNSTNGCSQKITQHDLDGELSPSLGACGLFIEGLVINNNLRTRLNAEHFKDFNSYCFATTRILCPSDQNNIYVPLTKIPSSRTRALMFGVRNKRDSSSLSVHCNTDNLDVIQKVSLLYGNTHRFMNMNSSYFNKIVPYTMTGDIPEPGYYIYSFTDDIDSTSGSIDWSEINNVELHVEFDMLAKSKSGTSDQYEFMLIQLGILPAGAENESVILSNPVQNGPKRPKI